MKIFTRTKAISNWLNDQRKAGLSLGFVPTMGGLHGGHISLIEASKADTDVTVCSIFVNPSQFNDAADLQRYPRNHHIDIRMLADVGCDVVFLPNVMEVYPPGLDTSVDIELNGLDRKLEGEFRPGHFDGMIEVVHRLLTIIDPDRLYMGQKDFQQKTIVGKLLESQNADAQLVVCPIVREENGLAMSSRNVRLSKDMRERATVIYKTLQEAKKTWNTTPIQKLKDDARAKIKLAGLKPEYVEICDALTLNIIENWEDSDQPVIVLAAWAGDVRLIDNEIL